MPGSDEPMVASLAGPAVHPAVVWAKHGVLARSDRSVGHAADLVEYVETAARYEYLDLVAGGAGRPRPSRDPAAAVGAGPHPARTTARSSPASTCRTPRNDGSATVPVTGAVTVASIFMASMTATGRPACTRSPTSTAMVTTPA